MIDFDAQIEHHFGAGVYIRKASIPANHFVVSHKHKHDHLSVLASGTVLVEVDGGSKLYTAPAVLTISAGKNHTIRALSDATWMCIHATEETEDVDEVLIERAA